jgi:phospholipid-binding lipoprotein MlaA
MLRRMALVTLAWAALLTGCATAPGRAPTNPQADPWEGFNRGVFAFNDAMDEAVLKPVATAYRDIVPSAVRTGVANFFGNVEDAWSAIHHFLQGKPHSGLEMTMRVAVNSSFGLLGLLDPATELKLERRSEDFGQTLAVWGMGPGPYVVLPLFGPSTVRDALARPLDMAPSPSLMTDREAARSWLRVLGIVDTRARLLAATDLLGQAALDRYSFARDAYLARRLDQVYDGAPPLDDPDPDADAPPAPAATASGPRR